MNINERCERCWTGLEGHNQALCDVAWEAYCQNIEFMGLTHTKKESMMASQKEDLMPKTERLVKIHASRCPKCNSGMTYFRVKTSEYHCRNCGENWKEKQPNQEA